MKRSFSFIFVLILFIAGCHFELPQKVSVKTNASYNLTIGMPKIEFDYFSEENLSKMFAGEAQDENASQIEVFDYNPVGENDNIQKLLLKVPIQTIPIDIEQYLNETGFSEDFESQSMHEEFEIPDISINDYSDIDITNLKEVINNAVVLEGNTEENAFRFAFDDFTTFESVNYKSGYLVLFPKNGFFIDDNTVNIKYNDNVILSGTVQNNMYVVFSLNNTTLYKDGMTIEFEGVHSKIDYTCMLGGTKVFSEMGMENYMGVLPSPEIAKISGLDFALSDENALMINEDSIDINFEEKGIDSLKIAEGEIEFGIVFPESWEGVDYTYSIDIRQEGAGVSESERLNKTLQKGDKIDLEGVCIDKDSDEIKYSGKINLIVNDGTIDFEENIQVSVDGGIERIDYVALELKDFESEKLVNADLPAEMAAYVDYVMLSDRGLEINYAANLPEGNDIGLTLISSKLGIDSTKTLTEGVNSFVVDDSKKMEIEENTSIDFSVNIALPTLENKPNLLCIRNVELNKKYEIELTIKPVIDVDSVALKPDALAQTGTIDTGFSMSSLFDGIKEFLSEDFANSIEFKEIPLYLFFDKPNVATLESLSCTDDSYLKLQIGTDASTSRGCTMEFNTTPELNFEEGTVTTNLSGGLTKNLDLAKLINDSKNVEGSIVVDYKLGLKNGSENNLIIDLDDIEDIGNSSISISAMIELPLSFSNTSTQNLDLMELMGEDSMDSLFADLKNASDTEIDQMLDVIDSVELGYDLKNIPFEAEGMLLKIGLNENNVQECAIEKGTIKVSPEELFEEEIKPVVQIVIPETDFSIVRVKQIETDIMLRLNTNGEILLFGGEK